MDIHRARFVPYPPSAINALAFSHADPTDGSTDPENLRLALGRANGNIEIWNPANGQWLQERVFYGGKDRSVEGLAWTQEPNQKDDQGRIIPGALRLFSIGYSSSVTEWDLASGLPLRHSDGNHSEVWCLAAQPKWKANKSNPSQEDDSCQKLIAGCADGTLVLLSTADNDLRFEKFVARSTTKKARALSVVFKDRRVAVVGFADSTIRVYDTSNGYVIRNISLGNAGPSGPRETLVWKVKCLPNGDFVSGDSTGDIRIYSGKNYSQTQRISGHEADVLDLAVSRDGTMIFSGGMDRRTCFYVSNKKAANQGGKWRKVSHQRHHEHDVKALAAYDGTKLSIVVSGGIDTQPIIVPIRQFGKEHSRGLPALPQTPPVVSAPEARLLVSWWNCEVRIWSVKSPDDEPEKPKVVARLALQGDENITSATITKDGGILAISTVREVKLFQLVRKHSEHSFGVHIRKLELPLSTGAKLVRFSPDGKWLALVTASNDVFVARIIQSENPTDRPHVLDKTLHLQRVPRHTSNGSLNRSLEDYGRSITHLEFSTDTTVLAAVDLAGYIDTWVVEGHEDSTAPEIDINGSTASASDGDESDDEESPRQLITFLGQRWIRNPSAHLLPRLESSPVLVSFRPNPEGSRPQPNGNPAVHPTRHNPHPHSHDLPKTEQSLLVVTADHQMHLFDVLAGRLAEWSRRNPPSSYPPQYRTIKSPAKGCIWDVHENERLWLYGESWLFMFDLSKDLPIADPIETSTLTKAEKKASKKRKREAARDGANKGVSGAGDAVLARDAPVTKMVKFSSGQEDDAESNRIDLDTGRGGAESNEDEEVLDLETLASVRRSGGQDGVADATNGKSEEAEVEEGGGLEGALEVRKQGSDHWWHTFKYRPILGMVAIAEDGQPLEVVLVERPSWELDLPPRFVGAHE